MEPRPWLLVIFVVLTTTLWQLVGATGFCQGRQTLSDGNGTIGSGGSYGFYMSNMDCSWNIVSQDSTKVILLTFDFVATECGWDYVKVQDPNAPWAPGSVMYSGGLTVASLCGNRSAAFGYHDVIVSQGPSLLVHFTSDVSVESRGFQARSHFGAAYWPRIDSMYFFGGQTTDGSILPIDIVSYSFGSATWVNVTTSQGGVSTTLAAPAAAFWLRDILYIWQVLPSSNGGPPLSNYPTVVPVDVPGQSAKIYVFGGWIPQNMGYVGNRQLWVYDTGSGGWSQRNSSSSSPYAYSMTYGSAGVYHNATSTIVIFAQRSVMRYHIPSDLWYVTPLSVQQQQRSKLFSSASVVNDTAAVSFGGVLLPALSAYIDDQCYHSTISTFDLDCLTWQTEERPELAGKMRAGHASVYRNQQINIFGGTNGVDLADTFTFSPQPSGLNDSQRNACRAATYCSSFNDCADCLTRPYCGWCDNTCTYTASGPPSGSICTAQCPPRTMLALGQLVQGTLAAGQSIVYKTFVNAMDNDIYFTVSTSNGVDQLTLTVINTQSPPLFTAVLAQAAAIFAASDSRRHGGWYVVQLQNSLAGHPVSYGFAITLSPSSSVDGTGDGGSDDDMNATQIAVLVFSSLSLVFSVVVIIHRTRQLRQIRRRQAAASAIRPPAVTPPLFTVTLEQLRRDTTLDRGTIKSRTDNNTDIELAPLRSPSPSSAAAPDSLGLLLPFALEDLILHEGSSAALPSRKIVVATHIVTFPDSWTSDKAPPRVAFAMTGMAKVEDDASIRISFGMPVATPADAAPPAQSDIKIPSALMRRTARPRVDDKLLDRFERRRAGLPDPTPEPVNNAGSAGSSRAPSADSLTRSMSEIKLGDAALEPPAGYTLGSQEPSKQTQSRTQTPQQSPPLRPQQGTPDFQESPRTKRGVSFHESSPSAVNTAGDEQAPAAAAAPDVDSHELSAISTSPPTFGGMRRANSTASRTMRNSPSSFQLTQGSIPAVIMQTGAQQLHVIENRFKLMTQNVREKVVQPIFGVDAHITTNEDADLARENIEELRVLYASMEVSTRNYIAALKSLNEAGSEMSQMFLARGHKEESVVRSAMTQFGSAHQVISSTLKAYVDALEAFHHYIKTFLDYALTDVLETSRKQAAARAEMDAAAFRLIPDSVVHGMEETSRGMQVLSSGFEKGVKDMGAGLSKLLAGPLKRNKVVPGEGRAQSPDPAASPSSSPPPRKSEESGRLDSASAAISPSKTSLASSSCDKLSDERERYERLTRALVDKVEILQQKSITDVTEHLLALRRSCAIWMAKSSEALMGDMDDVSESAVTVPAALALSLKRRG
ncbi:hypothetical protein RI367_005629 [Sorochytrium milnesiophthora]